MELGLSGEFDPAVVSSQLGLAPTLYFSKGDRVGNGRTGRVRPNSGWHLESESAIAADTIEPHLEWLLNLIEPRAAALSRLLAMGIDGHVGCYWASVGSGGGPWIPPELMTRIGDLGLPLIISFYAVESG